MMGWEVVREGGENWRPGRGEEPDSSWDSWGEGRGGRDKEGDKHRRKSLKFRIGE